MAKREHVTWLLAPPAERITPAVARDWLRRVYPNLAAFTALGYYDDALRPPRLRGELRLELGSLAADARRIATACAEAIATGRAVTMHLAPPWRPHRRLVRRLRAVLAFEHRSSRTKRSRVRGVLRTALRRLERDARRAA